jgi:dihydroneopterin aldolase
LRLLRKKNALTGRSRQDRLAIIGVRLRPRIGVTPGERRFPQACSADIAIWGDFETAALTDELSDALDYSKVLEKVVEVAHMREYNLLETLAYGIARAVLVGFRAQRVNVKVRKQPATLIDKLDYIEVEVEQS